MVSIFNRAGTGPDRNERSIEYDTVNDAYLHRLFDEILPVVAKSVNRRTDAYSRAIQGLSSGAIMAFNAAFTRPDSISRVLSWIGSYTALRPSPGHPEGGGEYPTMVRREAKSNIRIWLEDGSEDLDNRRKLACSQHRHGERIGRRRRIAGVANLALARLRSGKISQEFVQEPAEKDQPVWRMVQLNRQ